MIEMFDRVYEENYTKLYTLAFRMTGNKQDAEDVLQNAFLNAYKAFENFKQNSSIYTWLYRIVVNEAQRHRKYSNKLPVDIYADEHGISSRDVFQYINSFGEVEDEVLVNSARESCLQIFMNCMPAKYRVVFTLRIILQFSVKETAEILEISENAVKVDLHRARSLIKDIMEGRCSLINPENPCKCSSWAKYALETNRNIISEDIEAIRKKEKLSTEKFHEEIKEILTIPQLYNTEILPECYGSFKERIKKIIAKGELKLLDYTKVKT